MASTDRRVTARRAQDATDGPWKKWRGMTRHARAIRFIETYCKPPKGMGHGKPMKLGVFQKEFLEEALADGISTAVFPTPAGNGKSTFGGGVACWAGFDDDETGAPQVPIIATTVGQAVRSVYGVTAAMVRASPELASRSVEYTGIATPRIWIPKTDGLIFPISNDLDGIQGLDPSTAIIDELGFQPVDVWSAMLARDGKRERSLIFGMGTPGLDRNNALWSIRTAVMEGRKPPSMAWREYAADDGCAIDDREQWRKANPAIGAGFMRESGLESAMSMPEAHFRIYRLGQWVDGTDSWLGADGRRLWAGLKRSIVPKLGAPTWVGVDVGIKRDSTAVCIVQQLPDGHLGAWVRLWIPTKEEPVDVTDVMHHLRTLAKTYRVEGISYDARFFDVPAKMLSDERLPMVEVPQSPERMAPIIADLYDRIQRGEVHHDGDEAFATQVLNAIPRHQERGGFTLQKAKSRGRIDACIALALAVDRAQNRRRRSPLFVGSVAAA